jgi:hypothetical protein
MSQRWWISAVIIAYAGTARAEETRVDEMWFGEPSRIQSEPSQPLARAPEPPAPPFGTAGQFVVTSASTVGVSYRSWDSSEASAFSAAFAPGLDFFIVRNLSLGIELGAAYSLSRGYGVDGRLVQTRGTTLSGGVRTGLNVPLGTAVSWYPKLTFGVHSTDIELRLLTGSSVSTPESPLEEATTRYLGPWLAAFAPVVLHPRSHFFIGLGPSISHGLARARGAPQPGGERTAVGGRLVIGGFWGGRVESRTQPGEASDPSVTAPHRFGQRGQLVFSSESALYARWLTEAGSGASSTQYALAPAVDYFLLDRMLVGLAFHYSSSRATGVDPLTRLEITGSAESVGGGLRLGADVPLGTWLSFDPRLSFAVSAGDRHLESERVAVAYTTTAVTLSLYAPLLVHAAPHAFLGFGPAASRDFERTADFGSASLENPRTALGASLVVGGWID